MMNEPRFKDLPEKEEINYTLEQQQPAQNLEVEHDFFDFSGIFWLVLIVAVIWWIFRSRNDE